MNDRSFLPPTPPKGFEKTHNAGERTFVRNNTKEIVAELNSIRVELATNNPVDLSPNGLIYNALAVIGGDLANLQQILYGNDLNGPLG